MHKKKALILARDGITTKLLGQLIEKHYSEVSYILENAPSKKDVLKRRAKKIGWSKVLGQIAFLTLVVPFIKNKNRVSEIILNSGLDVDFELNPNQHNVININDSIEHLDQLEYDIVFVNGTRILSKELLSKISVPIINIHVGITPKYRGIHGGFWAVKNNDLENFGVTIHHVDSGIDTGEIIDQVRVTPSKEDNYSSYPILQYVAALKRLDTLISENEDFYSKSIEKPDLPSQLHYHPTIWQYLF